MPEVSPFSSVIASLLIGISYYEARSKVTECYSARVTYVNSLYEDIIAERKLTVTVPTYFSIEELDLSREDKNGKI